jgi:hypothetical protein
MHDIPFEREKPPPPEQKGKGLTPALAFLGVALVDLKSELIGSEYQASLGLSRNVIIS